MKDVLKNGKISKLTGGDTGHAFLLEYEGKKYVLRKFEDEKVAEYYFELCKKLEGQGFLPHIYYKEGKNIIFEYIEGRDCNKKDAVKVAFQVGKICSLINKIDSDENYSLDERFVSYLKDLKDNNFIDSNESSIAIKIYHDLKKKINPKIVMDANDVYPENFRLRGGAVYLVDIEAIKPMIKGFGVAKSFVRWFRTPKQRENFKKGYESVQPISFLTEGYLKFLYLNFLARSVSIKIRLKTKLNPKDIEMFRALIH